jgi:hypothetical protein
VASASSYQPHQLAAERAGLPGNPVAEIDQAANPRRPSSGRARARSAVPKWRWSRAAPLLIGFAIGLVLLVHRWLHMECSSQTLHWALQPEKWCCPPKIPILSSLRDGILSF